MFSKLINWIKFSHLFIAFGITLWAIAIYMALASHHSRIQATENARSTAKLPEERLANPDYLYVVSDPNTINNLQQKIKIQSIQAVKYVVILNPDGTTNNSFSSVNPIYIISSKQELETSSKPPSKPPQ